MTERDLIVFLKGDVVVAIADLLPNREGKADVPKWTRGVVRSMEGKKIAVQFPGMTAYVVCEKHEISLAD